MKCLIIVFMMCAISSFAQEVEHNYEMGPQITTCDSLQISGLAEQDQIAMIEKAKFRFVENMKLNRKQGFQAAWFYSCDNEHGYIVAKIDDVKKLYREVSVAMWKKFISSGDFESFLEQMEEVGK